MTSYIAPLRIMGTDPVRVNTNNAAVQSAGAKNFFGYPSTAGTANDCGPQNQPHIRGNRELGYLAPPPYGVWATAPYLHNGSAPNVWEVLKPADRKPIRRRVSAPPRWDQPLTLMGFDTDLQRAYDSSRLGWKYDTIPCKWRTPLNPAVSPYINCQPGDEFTTPLAQEMMNVLFSNLALSWNILFPPTRTRQQLEDRKIYNTNAFGQDNGGHEFNSVLTDVGRGSPGHPGQHGGQELSERRAPAHGGTGRHRGLLRPPGLRPPVLPRRRGGAEQRVLHRGRMGPLDSQHDEPDPGA
ncbi:hypothetical protein [Corallococcus exiguus]|uniref:c-type cytochrome n=1 Tax=Corallococcus exiguus TaxID=83462 RepID=UPI002015F8E4|nr:hypothetical protein [Corallococcus exiguus]